MIYGEQLNPEKASILLMEVFVSRGCVGLILDRRENLDITKEIQLSEGKNQITLKLPKSHLSDLFIRNINADGSSTYQINDIQLKDYLTIDLGGNIQEQVNEMLRLKDSDYKKKIASEYGYDYRQIEKINAPKNTNLNIDLNDIFDCKVGKSIINSMNLIMDNLEATDPEKLSKNQGLFDINYFKSYLKQSTVRVFHLIKMMEARNIKRAKILDVGAFLGTFAIPLQNLGHQVIAVDRFSSFDGALDALKASMTNEGVEVISVAEENESKIFAELGVFDLVISMAVIEHIPHTPRFFLENLKRCVKQKGWFAIDTPNLSRFWNRRSMMENGPIMQDIKYQYFSKIPFMGHHREYTRAELIWMFEEVGYSFVEAIMFDYNILQFEKLSRDHLFSLLSMQVDPTLMDTIMVIGRNEKL